jgi:iron complex outermembrane receptor protein
LRYDEGIVWDLFGIGFVCEDPELPTCTFQSETPFGENETESWAIYGDFTYHLNDRWSVTAGARYTDDTKDFFYNNPATDGVGGAMDIQIFGPITDGSLVAKDSWNSFDPRLAVDFRATDNTTIFANIAGGYKSGGLNRQTLDFLPATQSIDSFDEEQVVAYEIGTKSKLLDGRATLNFSAFFNDYEDYQLETVEDLLPIVRNIGDIETKGIEVEGRILVTDNFELAGTYAYLDTEVTDSIDPALVGKETPQSPEHSGSIQAHYYIPASSGEWKLSGIWAFSDSFYFDIFNTLEQPSYNTLNLRVGYKPNSGRWSVAAFADNVTDEEYFAERFAFLDIGNRRAPGSLFRLEATVHF